MKLSYLMGALAIAVAGCQPAAQPEDDGNMAQGDNVKEIFEKNCATVRAGLTAFIQENMDHAAFYADSAVMVNTHYNGGEEMPLDKFMENHEMMWAAYDFYVDMDSLNLLPGVNPDTKEMDGSVRYYADWKVTVPATDSTEERSGVVRLYESFDFNKDGKIVFQQFYGDVTGLMMYLAGQLKDKEMGEEDAAS